jgi:hypothetical protein
MFIYGIISFRKVSDLCFTPHLVYSDRYSLKMEGILAGVTFLIVRFLFLAGHHESLDQE